MLYPTTQLTIIIIFVSLVFSLLIIIYFSKKKNKSRENKKSQTPTKSLRNIRQASQFLIQNPGDMEMMKRLANSYYAIGEWKQAERAYRKILDSGKKGLITSDVYFQYGISCMNLKMYSQAVESLKAVQSLNKNTSETSYNLGYIYYKQKQYTEAIRQLRQALTLNVSHRQAKRLLALSLVAIQRYREARPLLIQGVAAYPNDEALQIAYAQCMEYFGKLEQALKYYQQLTKSQHFGPEALMAIGKIMIRYRNPKQAKKHLEQVLNFQNIPQQIFLEVHYILANMYQEENDMKLTTYHLTAINRVNPNYKDVSQKLNLFENENFYIYMQGQEKAFNELCTRIIPLIFPKKSPHILSSSSSSLYSDFIVEIREESLGNLNTYMVRFIRNKEEINETLLRDLNSQFSDAEAHAAICITAGTFSPNAKNYALSRPIELWNKKKLDSLLSKL